MKKVSKTTHFCGSAIQDYVWVSVWFYNVYLYCYSWHNTQKVFIMTAKIGYLPILCAFKFNAYWAGIVFSYDCVEVATVDNSNCVLHNALVAVIAVEEYELSKKVVSRL